MCINIFFCTYEQAGLNFEQENILIYETNIFDEVQVLGMPHFYIGRKVYIVKPWPKTLSLQTPNQSWKVFF